MLKCTSDFKGTAQSQLRVLGEDDSSLAAAASRLPPTLGATTMQLEPQHLFDQLFKGNVVAGMEAIFGRLVLPLIRVAP